MTAITDGSRRATLHELDDDAPIPYEDMLPGDVFGMREEMGYRNHGKRFWDGISIVDMHVDLDDYGAVPPCFTITGHADGFHAHHWKDVIDHNAIVWVDFGPEVGGQINAFIATDEVAKVFVVNGVDWLVVNMYASKRLLDGEGRGAMMWIDQECADEEGLTWRYPGIPARQMLCVVPRA